MSRFKTKEIKIYKEDTYGTKPASPVNYILPTTTGFDVKENPNSEDLAFLVQDGEASDMAYGLSTVDGNIETVLTAEMLLVIASFLYSGSASANATVDVWVTNTAYTAGDIVNHSDGTHSLYCKVGGTSDATEPVISTLSEFDEVIDNGVVWVVRPILKRYQGNNKDCAKSFGLEMTLEDRECAGSPDSDVFFRYEGCLLGTSEFGKSGGDVSLKTSLGIMATSFDDSIENASYVAQGGTDVYLNQKYLENCHLSLLLDDAVITETTEGKITTDRNITSEPAIDCKHILAPGVISHKGSISTIFNSARYSRGQKRTPHDLKLVYDNGLGDNATIHFPIVKFGKVPPEVSTDKFTILTPEIMAIGTPTVPSADYDITVGIDVDFS